MKPKPGQVWTCTSIAGKTADYLIVAYDGEDFGFLSNTRVEIEAIGTPPPGWAYSKRSFPVINFESSVWKFKSYRDTSIKEIGI